MDFNIALINEAVSARIPEREAIIWRDRRITFSQLTDRTRRLGNYLRAHGMGHHIERANLKNWESGQDHLALYLHNGNEFIEGMLGAYKARVAPFNVNYRYINEELSYLLNDASASGIIYHSTYAPTLADVISEVPSLKLLLQVQDDSGNGLLPGAVWYEDALSESPATPVDVVPSPDDLYILYTGGTTGMPKGVLWRQDDIFAAALGGPPRRAAA